MNKKETLIKQKLFEIANHINKVPIIENQSGVLSGSSGIILFQFYFSKYSNNDFYADLALNNLKRTIEKIGTKYNALSYCSGLAGLGWVIDHLKTNELLEVDSDSLLTQFDQVLYECMISEFDKNHLDFLHGSIGIAYYFLNRYNSSTKLKEKYYKILQEIAIRIKNAAIEDEKGFTWEFEIEISESLKTKGFNLSLSHGNCSILNFLCRLPPDIIEKYSLDRIIIGGAKFIIGHVEKGKKGVSLLPSVIIPNTLLSNNSRLGWCYGDLGVGITLLRIANLFQKETLLLQYSLYILKHCASRVDKENTQVMDAMLCHGSFGIYQVFSRVFKSTNENCFKSAAEFWIEDGLKKAVHKDGYGGYKTWNTPKKKWVANTNVINGIAGIGLSLLDYLSEDYNWDECLMIG